MHQNSRLKFNPKLAQLRFEQTAPEILFLFNLDFVNDHLFYSDDDDDDDDDDVDDHNNGYIYLNVSDSSDDDVRLYRSRQHHAKYSDLMASRVSKAAANACKYCMTSNIY